VGSRITFSEHHLTYTLVSGLLIGASMIRAGLFFSLFNNFSFLYLSLYTTFESVTWQFIETFEIDFGKNSSGFL
jgi:hypothetical protein